MRIMHRRNIGQMDKLQLLIRFQETKYFDHIFRIHDNRQYIVCILNFVNLCRKISLELIQ
ncbi:hypothetical protein D3C73_641480 [compost metagenome]